MTAEYIYEIKKILNKHIEKIIHKIKYTSPGSILYLLYGKKKSTHSFSVKFGLLGEILLKELVKIKNLELLECGIQVINNVKKDIDLSFKDTKNNIIYYYEIKSNIDLDSEKIIATIEKCKYIEKYLKNKYENYNVISGILLWTIYDVKDLNNSKIKIFEKNEISVYYMSDFLKTIDICWDKENYYQYFRQIGEKINNS